MKTAFDRFYKQFQVSKKYILPYTGLVQSVIEIGCGEGGNLLPYLVKGCKIKGIDKSESKIKYASKYSKGFICTDIFDYNPDQSYDLILVKDVLEHIDNKRLFMEHIKSFMADHSKLFIAFSPWSMPYGGHQQCCRSFLRFIPYVHLLPFYRSLLEYFETPEMVLALLEIKLTRLSVKQFKQIISGYRIEKETFWLINPSYIRFGLWPVRFLNIRFLITSYWCIISKIK